MRGTRRRISARPTDRQTIGLGVASTGKQRRYLRGLAHSLRPTVHVGQRGLTDQVVRQVGTALDDQELIKVKLGPECPTGRKAAGTELVARTGCELAGTIGKVLILYRPHPEKPRIILPDGDPPLLAADTQAKEVTDGKL